MNPGHIMRPMAVLGGGGPGLARLRGQAMHTGPEGGTLMGVTARTGDLAHRLAVVGMLEGDADMTTDTGVGPVHGSP